MSDFKDQIFFQGSGLDSDNDIRYLKSGDSDYRLNIVPTDSGSALTLTNLKGNRKYTHMFTHNISLFHTTSSGEEAVYTCLGDCYDVKRNAVYMFIHSDLGNHSILRFNYNDKTFDKIVFDSNYLGFNVDYPITDSFMIDDYLFWNPRTSSPRMLHVPTCTNYYDYEDFYIYATYVAGDKFKWKGGIYEVILSGKTALQIITDISNNNLLSVKFTGDYYHDIATIDYFYNYPIQPEIPVSAFYSDNNSLNYNNLKGKCFQFTYNFNYPDGRTSLYAPFSMVYGQTAGEGFAGDDTGAISTQNTLTLVPSLTHGSEDWGYKIKSVDFLFRESLADGWGDWKLAGTVDRGQIVSTGATFEFRNDKSYINVDNDLVSSSHQVLPISSRAQWSIDGERVIYGGNTDGLKIVEPNVLLEEVFTEKDVDQLADGTPVSGHNYTVIETTATETVTTEGFVDTVTTYEYSVAITTVAGLTAGDVVVYTSNGNSSFLVFGSGWNLATYLSKLCGIINSGSTPENAIPESASITIQSGINQRTITVTAYADPSDLFTRKYGFKSGATHKFCLFYYDNLMRRTSAITNDDMSIYLPFVTEQTTIVNEARIYSQSVQFSINHLPPNDAKFWSIGYTGNTSISQFWQYTISSVDNGVDAYAKYTAIGINSLNKLREESVTNNYFPTSNIPAYIFESGDRIRFIMTDDLTGFNLPLTTLYDYEIKEYQDTGADEYIYIDLLSPCPIANHAIVEIYRPKKETTNDIYYETGDVYSLYTLNGVNYHTGLLQNQTTSLPAKLVLSRGDIYYLTRLFSEKVSNAGNEALYPVESFSYSDFADTRVWGQGRGGSYTGLGQTEDNTLRYSNKFINTTGINGISEFNGLDVVALTSLYGKVSAMRQIGYMLNVYMERNVATIPVGRSEQYTQDGTSQLWKNDGVLGTPNYAPDLFGTVHPESVKMVDKYVYFFDAYRGIYVRDAVNGMENIAGKRSSQGDYKMETYFKNKAKALLASGIDNTDVITSWDDEHGLVLVTFKDYVTPANNETIGFHEGTNRWVSFYELEGKQPDYIETDFLPPTYYIVSLSTDIEGMSGDSFYNNVLISNGGGNESITLYWKWEDLSHSIISSGSQSKSIIHGYNVVSVTGAVFPATGTYRFYVSTNGTNYIASEEIGSYGGAITIDTFSVSDGYLGQPLTNSVTLTNTGGATSVDIYWQIYDFSYVSEYGIESVSAANGTHAISLSDPTYPSGPSRQYWGLALRVGDVGPYTSVERFVVKTPITIDSVLVYDGVDGDAMSNFILVTNPSFSDSFPLYWTIKDSTNSTVSSGNQTIFVGSGQAFVSLTLTNPAEDTDYTLSVRLGALGTDTVSNQFDTANGDVITNSVTVASGIEGTVLDNLINVTNTGAEDTFTVYWRMLQNDEVIDSGNEDILIPVGTTDISLTTVDYPTYSATSGYELNVNVGSTISWKADTVDSTPVWSLPSSALLQAMYDNLFAYAPYGFTAARYWSANQTDASNSSYLDFSTNTNYYATKSNTYRVRAYHKFTSGLYSVGDTGPQGGYIFYISGTDCYECPATDQAAGKIWSNVGSTLVVGMGTDIDSGAANTLLIIAQGGHTDSAAKVCNDLIL